MISVSVSDSSHSTNRAGLIARGGAAALVLMAGTADAALEPVSITAKVSLGAVGQAFGLAVELRASIPDLPRDKAQALIDAAHQVCPYSNATRGNIVVDVQLAE